MENNSTIAPSLNGFEVFATMDIPTPEEIDAEVFSFAEERAKLLPWNAVQCDDSGEYVVWGDAYVHGPWSPEFDALMAQQVEMTIGSQYEQPYPKRRYSTRPGEWHATAGTWQQFVEGAGASRKSDAWGLIRHVEGERKDGLGYVFGVCSAGDRKKTAMREMYAMGLDIDDGADIDVVHDTVLKTGYACFMYTSFNHMKSTIDVPYGKVHAMVNGDITDEAVQTYLRKKKPTLGESFISQVTIKDEKLDMGSGYVIRCGCPNIHKIRLVFPFASPVNIPDLDSNPDHAPDAWRQKIKGLAQMLNVPHDTQCEDPSRIFYTARQPEGSDAFEVNVYRGKPITWGDISNRATNPFLMAGGGDNGPRAEIPQIEIELDIGKVDVTQLYRNDAKRWRLADICEHSSIETHWANDKLHVDCPYRLENHTNKEKNNGTFVVNAIDGHNDFSVVKCLHETCAQENGHTIYYLARWLEEGLLTVEDLEDPANMEAFNADAPFERMTPTEKQGFDEALAYFRKEGVDADADAVLQSIVEAGGDAGYARERVEEALDTVKRQLGDMASDKDVDPAAEERKRLGGTPNLTASLHDPKWVNEAGILVAYNQVNHAFYEAMGIDTTSDDPELLARVEVRNQIEESMVEMFDYVVVDGQAKVAIRMGPGKAPRLWKDTTLEKLYRNQWVLYREGEGKTYKTMKPHDVFLGSRKRSNFVDTCFEPNPNHADPLAYNLWTGFAVQPVEGDWSLLKDHIFNIMCNGNEDYFNFVMTFIASMFQRPWVKIPSALAFMGDQGTGKSKVFDWIRKAIGDAALKISSGRHLTGNFNAHLDGKIFLTCEEAFWAGDKSAAGPLKDIISSDTLQIEGKFENVTQRPNYVNVVFISNEDWVVPADGEDARRFLALRVSNAHKQDGVYFGAIDDQMENGGIEAMVHEFMNWNPECIGGWEGLRNPPKTEVLKEQAGMSLHGAAAILLNILKNGELAGRGEDGQSFYYELSDTEETILADRHLKAVLLPGADNKRGNLARQANSAIKELLGAEAHSGQGKTEVEYLKASNDTTPEKTGTRVRYVTVPPLNSLKDKIAAYGAD